MEALQNKLDEYKRKEDQFEQYQKEEEEMNNRIAKLETELKDETKAKIT